MSDERLTERKTRACTICKEVITCPQGIAGEKIMKNKQTINGDLVYKTLDILNSVDGEKDLKKLKLTPLEYETEKLLLHEYWENGEATTFLLNCANFFKKQGFVVKLTDDGVGYVIGRE